MNITYGRGVGYVFEEESFEDSISSISATKIRKRLRDEGKLDKNNKFIYPFSINVLNQNQTFKHAVKIMLKSTMIVLFISFSSNYYNI